MENEHVFDALMLAELEGETPTFKSRKVEVLPKSDAFVRVGKVAEYSLMLDPFKDGEGLLAELEPAAEKLRPKPEIAIVVDSETKERLSWIVSFHMVDDDAERRRYAFFDQNGNEQTLEVRYE